MKRTNVDVLKFSMGSPCTTDRGASLIEYALLIALIATVCFLAVQTLGTTTGTGLESDASSLFVR